jgi:hypothetical protein
MSSKQNHRTLDEFLLEKNRVPPERLEEIRRVHVAEGGGWAGHFVDAGAITENELLQLLIAETGLPYMPVLQITVAEEVMREFTLSFLQTFECLPIDSIGPVLTLATPNPLQPELLRSRDTAQRTVQLYLCRVSEWRESMRRLYERVQGNHGGT